MANIQTSSQETTDASPRFEFEYVTSAVSVFKDDGIGVHVVNDSGASENTRVVIFQNTGAGASTVVDTGSVVVIPTWVWSLGFTVSDSGEYWLRVQVTSEFLVPEASFDRLRDGIFTPVVSYRPGDFAIFDLHPLRKRIW